MTELIFHDAWAAALWIAFFVVHAFRPFTWRGKELKGADLSTIASLLLGVYVVFRVNWLT